MLRAVAMPKLRIDQRNQPSREFQLGTAPVTIGRGIGNTLHFRDPWLSREHAKLSVVDGDDDFELEDLGSRNGTYLNGKMLQKRKRLRTGDVITLGDVQLTYVDEAATSVRVADSGVSLDNRGTVMISSEELSYDRFRESVAAPQAEAPDAGALLPALHSVTSALVRHFPLDELVEKVLDLLLDAVPSERVALLLKARDGESPRGAGPHDVAGGLEVKARRGYGQEDEIRISRTIVQAVLEERQAVLTMDAQSDERFGQAVSIMMQGIRSVLAAPLVANDDEVIGLVYLDDRVSRAAFDENSLRLAGLIANLAAVKIDNCYLLEDQLEKRRMAEQLAVGAQIQRGLLPATDPQVDGYDICGLNRSCFEIGGDYFDFIPKDDGRLAMVVADVSGKGVGAALLMAVLQASVRALMESASGPAELVRRLNRVLVENSPDNKFATVFYAELDPVEHKLHYVSGGHNPSILVTGGETRELSSTGPIVGLVPGATFRCETVDLEPDSTLLIYTDGVTELENDDGEELGLEPLLELLAAGRWSTINDLVEEIGALMRAFAHREQFDDDTTLVVVHRTGE
ncbi:MAG: SpoIIE family protein phosphatase [Acidobacteriota bacterium]